MSNNISVKGARANNLKDIDVEIPRNQLTVITGVSGSGKSSLLFDVIFSEGQRKLLESMSSFSKRRIPMMPKADVTSIKGLSPVIAIGQIRSMHNPRSTVGTMTEISNYIRLLYATVGKAHCPYCEVEIVTKTANHMIEKLERLPKGTEVELLAPVFKIYGEQYEVLFGEIREKGYKKVRIDGKFKDISEKIELDEFKNHHIEVIVDKIIVEDGIYNHLKKSVENAFTLGSGYILFEIKESSVETKETISFYKNYGCSDHHIVMGELKQNHFSSNILENSCRTCRGLGVRIQAEKQLFIDDPEKSIRQGALGHFNAGRRMVMTLSKNYNFSLDTPYKDLPEEIRDMMFHGNKGEKISYWTKNQKGEWYESRWKTHYEGLLNETNRLYWHATRKGTLPTPGSAEQNFYTRHMTERPCPDCQGKKLNSQRLFVTVNGKNIYELGNMDMKELLGFIKKVTFEEKDKKVGDQIVKESIKRLELLIEIGLDYINLNRRADTLAGGEAQRIRIANSIGSEMTGMLYCLDEPTIGLHPRDSYKVVRTLKRLRDLGCTVMVVEHDLDTIKNADTIIEIGPGPGSFGGEIVIQGKPEEIMEDNRFLTGQYLTGRKTIALPSERRTSNGKVLKILGAKENNLKNIDIEIPLGVLVSVTGVSGSGKSSLIHDILFRKLYSIFYDKRIMAGKHDEIQGVENISDIRNIDQSPIGRTPRSNPATYVGFFDKIRKLFKDTEAAKQRNFGVSYFSFNHKNGRCIECEGEGEKRTDLQFMPDIRNKCPLCNGARYNRDVLEIKYRGKNIAEILDMSVEEALEFFEHDNTISYKLKVMNDLGLGYLKLGQSATTLSGGEAQRIKLSKELGKIKRKKNNLYLLDEPTVGLHMEDIQKLLTSLNKIVDDGNTVLVVEHHLDVIKSSDHVIDLGPEGGSEGGSVIAQGAPEEIAKVEESYTGQFLKELL
ncbi:MAG: UvrABC system protein A [Candidatus Heimdallarchaeota archaeon AB_125]|nr:MAG: UvrABC system protein A [Candidatus Heimdallarchaeota archaeon AB_125]